MLITALNSYLTCSRLRRFQVAFKRLFSFSPVVFYGRGMFQYSYGWLPFRRRIVTVVGAPIHVERCEQPTREQIDVLHAEYCRRLCELFDEHKTKYGISPDQKLEIVCEQHL